MITSAPKFHDLTCAPLDKPKIIITMSTGDILAPMPVHTNPQRNLRVLTTQDLNTSVNATLACNTDDRFAASDDQIKEDEYTVPDAPPPSPVMFRSDLWPASIRR
ncbi:hypothetical protein CC79DRAFT_1362745 [Sarocladium strictum]